MDNRTSPVAIVDDDAAVLDSLQFLLEVAGYTVVVYASATKFLEADGVRPACLIVDQHMPGMTGLELAERLHSTGAGVPVMLITGSPTQAIVSKAAQLGIERVLEKPPTEAELLRFVGLHC